MAKAKPRAPLRIEQVPLEQMRPAPWNPRTIDDFQLSALRASLEEFGAVEPVVLDQRGRIVGGHQRVEAARQLGWTSLPAVRVELTPKQAKLLNLALNRISGEWDDRMLGELLEGIVGGEPAEVLLAGFPEDEVANLLSRLGEPVDPEAEWTNMPDFDSADVNSAFRVTVHFATDEDAEAFFKMIDRPRARYLWWPEPDGFVGSDQGKQYVADE